MSAAKQGIFDFAKPTLPTEVKSTYTKSVLNGILSHNEAYKAGIFPNEYEKHPIIIDEYAKMDEAEFTAISKKASDYMDHFIKGKMNAQFNAIMNMKPCDVPQPPNMSWKNVTSTEHPFFPPTPPLKIK